MTPEQEQEKRFRFQAQLEQELNAQIDAANPDIPPEERQDGSVYTRIDTNEPDPADVEQWENASTFEKVDRTLGNWASGGFQSLLSLPDIPANLYNLGQTGLKKAGIVDEDATPVATMSSMYYPDLMDKMSQRHVPKGVSKTADVGRTVAEWLAPAVLPIGITAKMPKQAAMQVKPTLPASITDKMVKPYPTRFAKTQPVAAALRKAPKPAPNRLSTQVVKPELYAAASAGLGTASEIPYADVALGLAGGFFGAKTPRSEKLTKSEKDAIRVITKNLRASTPESIDNLRKNVAKGEKGTLADLMESPNMYGVEEKLADVTSSNTFSRKVGEMRADRLAGAVDDAKAVLPQVDSTPFIQGLQKESRKRLGRINTVGKQKSSVAAAQANDAAREAARLESAMLREEAKVIDKVNKLQNLDTTPAAVKNAPRLSKASSKLAENTKKLAGARFEKANKVMDDYKQTPPVDIRNETTKMLDDFNAEYADSVNDLSDMKRLYGDELRKIQRWETEPATPTDILNVTKTLRDKTWKAKDSEAYAHTIADNLRQKLNAMLEDAPNTETYRKANKLYAQTYSDVIPPKVQKALKEDNADLFAESLKLHGTNGAYIARWAKGMDSKRVENNVKKVLNSLADNEGVDEKFMSKYKEILLEFPDLKRQFRSKITADNKVGRDIAKVQSTSKLKQATLKDSASAAKQQETLALDNKKAALERAEDARTAANKSTVGKFATEPAKELKSHLTNINAEAGVQGLKTLKRQAVKDGNMDGFKAQINEQIADLVLTKTDDLSKATGKTLSKFENVKKRLLKAEVITPEEAENLTASYKRIRAIQKSGDKITPAQIIETLTGWDNIKASALSLGALQALPTSSHQLILANRIKDAANALIVASKNKPETLLRMEEFILNPEKFLKAIDKTKDVDAAYRSWFRLMTRRTGRGAVGLTKAARHPTVYTPDAQEDE